MEGGNGERSPGTSSSTAAIIIALTNKALAGDGCDDSAFEGTIEKF